MGIDEPPLAPETEVELWAGERLLTSWMCTPQDLPDLAVGWLIGEGRVSGSPPAVTVAEGLPVRVFVDGSEPARRPVDAPQGGPRRCGSFPEPASVSDGLRDLFATMFGNSTLRERTGGVHTGALVVEGRVVAVREDVSRHCVMDKLVGAAVLGGHPLPGSLVLVSGRISGSIAAKAARSGVAMVATMSIPTTLAADIAGRSGVWLVGRARGSAPTVYAPEA